MNDLEPDDAVIAGTVAAIAIIVCLAIVILALANS